MARAGKSTSTSTSRKPPAATPEAYIASQPAAAQPYLRRLRAAIKEAAPGAQERISYGIVGYFYPTRLVYIGGAARHVALYPAGDAKGLENYRFGASTLRFPLDQPLPLTKIKALVRARVRERDGETVKQKAARAPHARSAR
jgi:uncharacterized protein YdhG (YjbR/CyaY superfamily)